jgi:O-antigen/teichoic acid export membrane protein
MALANTFLKYTKNKEAITIAIYTFANFFSKGVSFILLFYFTKVLTQADFGMLSLFSNAILFLMPFISLGILQSINTDFFRFEKSAFKNFFTSSAILPVCATIIAIVAFFLFQSNTISHYNFPTSFIIILPVIALLSFVNEQLIILLRNNNQPIQYLYINIGRLLIEIAIAVILISGYNYGWMGRVAGILISYLIVANYAIYYFTKNNYLFGKVEIKYIKSELQFCIPIITLQLAVFCLSSSAVYYIEHFTKNLADVGIYSVSATFAFIVNVFCVALLQYFQPKIYSILSAKYIDKKALRKNFLLYTGAMICCTVLVLLAVPLAYYLFLSKAYISGLQYYYFICIGQFFWAITYFLFSFLFYYKKKKNILLISCVGIVLSIIFNIIGARYAGTLGLAIASCCSYSIVLLISIFIVQKQLKALL